MVKPNEYPSQYNEFSCWRGEYNAGWTYDKGEAVSYLGSSYVCLEYDVTGIVPTNESYWGKLALKGDIGETGPAGPEGPEGPPGEDGEDGVGIPAGGTTGQHLTKTSDTDYDTGWSNVPTHPDLATHDALGLATDSEVSTAISTHEGGADPHTGYVQESAHTKTAHDALGLSHDSLTDVSSDDHHAKSHAHDGADGSGTVSHANLTNVTADQHHAEAHAAAKHNAAVLPGSADESLGAHYMDVGGIAAPANPASGTRRLFVDTSDGKLKVRTNAGSSVSLEEQGGGVTFGAPTGGIDIGDTAVEGTSGDATRADHQHAFTAPGSGYPVDVAASEDDGTATTPARSDHRHAHGSGYTGGHTDVASHAAAAHNAATLPGSADEDLGAHYLDADQIAAPANPAAGTRRLYVDSGTGKLSVRTSGGTSVSLEEQGGGGTPADSVVTEKAFGQSEAIGTETAYAREDHTHGTPTDPVPTHEAAGDPHTGYRLESADHSHATTGMEGGTVSHDVLTGVSADDHHAQSHGKTDHSGAVLPGGANEDLGAYYLDLDQISVPTDPASGTRRLFVDTATGKLSVRTAASATVSLEEQGGGAHTHDEDDLIPDTVEVDENLGIAATGETQGCFYRKWVTAEAITAGHLVIMSNTTDGKIRKSVASAQDCEVIGVALETASGADETIKVAHVGVCQVYICGDYVIYRGMPLGAGGDVAGVGMAVGGLTPNVGKGIIGYSLEARGTGEDSLVWAFVVPTWGASIMASSTAENVWTSGSGGSGTNFSRGDHVHAHGTGYSGGHTDVAAHAHDEDDLIPDTVEAEEHIGLGTTGNVQTTMYRKYVANEAISIGHCVEASGAVDGRVKKATSNYSKALGVALDAATQAGDTIRVAFAGIAQVYVDSLYGVSPGGCVVGPGGANPGVTLPINSYPGVPCGAVAVPLETSASGQDRLVWCQLMPYSLPTMANFSVSTPTACTDSGDVGTSSLINHSDHRHGHGTGYAGGHTDVASHGLAAHTGAVLPGAANEDLGGYFLDADQISTPANPASGTRRLFVDSADGKLKVRTSAGTSVSLEEQGGGGTPADSVVTEKSFGQSEAIGTDTAYAREDHTHGTPTDPVPTHEAASDPHTGYRLETADHSHQSTGMQAGQLDHGLALTGLSDDDHPQYQLESEKDAASGYCGLDASALVPDARIPSGIARDSEVTGAITTHEGAGDPHAGYVLESAHTKTAHDSLGLSHDSLTDVSSDDHHAQLHHTSHNTGQGDAIAPGDIGAATSTHDHDATYVNEADHTKAAHDALGLSHDSLADVSADDHHAESHAAAKHNGAVLPGSADESFGTHYADLGGITAPANPSSGTRRLFVDTATGKLSVRTSAGSTVSLEEQGGGGTPSDTVESETTFGISSAAGSASAYSRGDHTHGSPTNPVTAHEGAGDPHTGYVLESEHTLTAHDTLGLATDTELSDHAGAADPHTGYRLESADHSHQSTGAEAGKLDHGLALTGLTDDDHTQYQLESEKGAASGYCPLDASALVPDANIPAAIARDSEVSTAVSTHEAASDPHTGYVLESLVDAKGDVLTATADNTPARLAVGTNGQHLEAASGETTGLKWASGVFNIEGTVLNPDAAINVIVWRAPFACTVTNVRGYRVGGTGATINARKNGSSNHLGTALSLTSADSWMDGGSVSNTAYAAGDKLEIMVVSVTGSPTQVAIQVDFTRP